MPIKQNFSPRYLQFTGRYDIIKKKERAGEPMRLEEAKAAYDAEAKRLLSLKDVIANILKYAVREFKGCTLQQIISCIDGEPEVSETYVDDEYTPSIDGAGVESVSVDEGRRSFDLKLKVKLPTNNEEAQLIINLESQNDYYPGYTLEKRGIYYLSRLISSQYNVEFKKSEFDKLKKVYSIWICNHAPQDRVNTITEYRFKPENLVGEVPDNPERYDLMSLIMINLGSEDKNYDGLIRMLDLLLNKYTKAEKSREAEETLKNDYNVKLRFNSKGDDDMCNLSQGIYNDGVAEGAVLKAIEVVKNLLADGFTLEKALIIADIDKETYEEYSAKEN